MAPSWQTNASILATVTNLAWAQDSLDIPLFVSLFTQSSPITFDVSQYHPEYPSRKVTPPQLASSLRLALGGFSSTQHILSNPTIRVNDNGREASVKTHVTAYHFLVDNAETRDVVSRDEEQEGKFMVNKGTWDVGLIKENIGGEEKWRIGKFLVRKVMPVEGETDLYRRAKERASTGHIRGGIGVPT
ncbi:MAG: hypothetical protein M1820_002317 [Bogoriella megaspora]|nr:MAG: hypothetical protein M1820_002317 [Bogoriella megaspora]